MNSEVSQIFYTGLKFLVVEKRGVAAQLIPTICKCVSDGVRGNLNWGAGG